jgi:hypothetical protein
MMSLAVAADNILHGHNTIVRSVVCDLCVDLGLCGWSYEYNGMDRGSVTFGRGDRFVCALYARG